MIQAADGNLVELLSAFTKLFTAAAAAGLGGAVWAKVRRNGGHGEEPGADARQAVILERMDSFDKELAQLAGWVRNLPSEIRDELREDFSRALAEMGNHVARVDARVDDLYKRNARR